MDVPTVREEAEWRDARLIERLDEVVPRIMEREDIEAWVVSGREYNEDPVLVTMLPATWITARRRTVLVFTDWGRTRAAVSRYGVGEAFPAAWDGDGEVDQWAVVAALLAESDPRSIAVDRSSSVALADGMSASEYDAFVAALPKRLLRRLVAADGLAVGWLESRVPAEVDALRSACRIAHGIIETGLSAEAVVPGRTTTRDLEWWFRERVRELGITVWFHPAVSVQRSGEPRRGSFAAPPPDRVIRPGDLVHVDFGISVWGMHTDQQQHAYVLAAGERTAPAGLQAALDVGCALQDLVIAEFAVGRTGNEVLAAARAAAIDDGIRPRIYSHPIGVHGHGAGPSIGLWDGQGGVAGAGDLPIRGETAWSIELSVDVDVAEWGGQTVSIMLEEDAFFTGDVVEWLDGRQTQLHLIG